LRAREGGVLVRAGQTEASVDLARLAGLTPAGVICEIMNEDGTMARVPQLVEFCQRHGLKMISVADLIRYRLQHERYIRRVVEGCIETEFGGFRTYAYTSDISPEMHMALIRGEVAGQEGVLVRMHSHCVHGDVFGSTHCDCQKLIRGSLRRIAEEEMGVLVYLHQTGPGFPHAEKSGGPGPHGVAQARLHALCGRRRATAVAVRKRHRRADSFGFGIAYDTAADEPSAEDCGAGGIWH
jgi:3,4-dihydroxy 2-butanone 4-phosphate synthase / GTP cyclohydrolase II